ncbi:hypothetical protein [Geomonas anaerohicana]|uniref:Uncharacterized protein n=1 Tax=Geomonas anaerohicana TaxID=2798583 RepID=A0ABS0YD94_9BACT|nr:hypothetical protein [Geomonas anaerohicana]MBJ6749884.1 hypothetical protein [Geomonas anaerohicana]
MKWTPVLELGSEGGCIVLEGRQDARGPWFFRFRTNEAAIEELCFSETYAWKAAPRTPEAVKGLDTALEKLGERYEGWADLYPVYVRPKFAAQICSMALSRSTYSTFQWQEIADNLYFMSDPIASVQSFEKALYCLRNEGSLSATDIKMLTAQYRARHSTITATELAKAAGFSHYSAANIHYGKLAHRIADRLGFNPPKGGSDGRALYWTALSYSESKPAGEFRFIMRPELAKALKACGIIKPLQNRVLPTGEIVAASSVGTLMGNRGASAKLHTKDKLLKSQYNPRQVDWKFCVLEAKDGSGNCIQRELMSSKSYTELFFLDEATAFAAGHRPCTCQGRKFYEFIERWVLMNGKEYGVSGGIKNIDRIIAEERLDSDGNKVTYAAVVDGLPDGTMVEHYAKIYLVWGGSLREWSLGGYVAAISRPKGQQVRVLTPRSVVNCFGAEYRPEVHPTAKTFVPASEQTL